MEAPAPESGDAAEATETAAVTGASSDTLEITVDDSFAVYAFTWDRIGSETYIRYRPVMENGQMYVCGALSTRGGSDIRKVSVQAMRRSTIEMNGSSIMRNMNFFNIVSNANLSSELVGTTASCQNSGLSPTQAEFQTVRLVVPSGRFSFRR